MAQTPFLTDIRTLRSRVPVRNALLALCLSSFAAHAQAPAGDPEAGAAKAAACAGCHGIPGYRNAYPAYRVPKLGGQHAEYLIAALQGYQSGARIHPTMQAIAAGLNEQDMADLAAFFAGAPSRSAGAGR